MHVRLRVIRYIVGMGTWAQIGMALATVGYGCAQTGSFSLERVMGAAFPSHLAASSTTSKVAWVSNARGVRNIMVAEPPRYIAQRATSYTADDGQELSDLHFTPEGAAIVYVRG